MAFRATQSIVLALAAGAVAEIPMPGMATDLSFSGLSVRTMDTLVADTSAGSNLSITFDGSTPSPTNAAIYLPCWSAGPQVPVSIPPATTNLSVYNGSTGTIALFLHFGSSQER